ncbi:unnamed protein product [Enterobius vermicularis]|uniref:Ion_trans_2 domain-containing protein n=1 Tax=Enterobius vermicularis TaxID=51028 RepID=A0A0N4VMW5_ENTVE|nr:unnamed protein product [Enterobius vermicularis]
MNTIPSGHTAIVLETLHSSRSCQRLNALRRHASQSRGHTTAARTRTTLSDTKSIRSVRSLTRYDHHKPDIASLSGRNKMSQSFRSPNDSLQRRYPVVIRHTLPNNWNNGCAKPVEKNDKTFFGFCCNSRKENDQPYTYIKGGIPVRYINHTNDPNRGTIMELKTYVSGTNTYPDSNLQSRSRTKSKEDNGQTLTAHLPSSSSLKKLQDATRENDRRLLPQITISDNEKEETSAQLTASDDEFVADDLKTIEETEGRGGTVSGNIPIIVPGLTLHHSMALHKHPSLDSSLARRLRGEYGDSRSHRSWGSERSDELSSRSFRRSNGTYKREKMPVSVGIITVIVFIAAGAILFAVWENWNLFDGAYYSFITLSTIGFGDIVPGQSLGEGSQEKLIVCALYLLFGMALIAMCFKLMQDDVVQKARWLGQKIGIIVKEEKSDSESDLENEVVLEEDEDEDILSEERTDQDKRTMSSESSRRDDDDSRKVKRNDRRTQTNIRR